MSLAIVSYPARGVLLGSFAGALLLLILLAIFPCSTGQAGCGKFQAMGIFGLIFMPVTYIASLVVLLVVVLPTSLALEMYHHLSLPKLCTFAGFITIGAVTGLLLEDPVSRFNLPNTIVRDLLLVGSWVLALCFFYWFFAIDRRDVDDPAVSQPL
jgi:hypothetical protein